LATFAAQCIRCRVELDAESWKCQEDRVAALLDGFKDGDRDEDIDPAALTSLVQNDLLVQATLVADEAFVELRKDGGVWACAAAGLMCRLSDGDLEVLAYLVEHVVVGGDVPRRDGKGVVRVVAGFPYSWAA
jgi:hypothetical protein